MTETTQFRSFEFRSLRFVSCFVLRISCLAVIAGCGSGKIPVDGTVLLDGQPLANADVLFMPKSGGRPATGKTNADGKFKLSTDRPDDGVLPGEYDVGVNAVSVTYEKSPDGSEFAERDTWLAPQRYGKPSTSGLTAKISASERTPKIELQSK
jgi:hypothetical protein